jgi:hypothetical protein
MGPPPAAAKNSSPDTKSVKKMLAIFGVLAIVGVLLLSQSVVLGLVFLGIAEVFFAVAYRRFSKTAKTSG